MKPTRASPLRLRAKVFFSACKKKSGGWGIRGNLKEEGLCSAPAISRSGDLDCLADSLLQRSTAPSEFVGMRDSTQVTSAFKENSSLSPSHDGARSQRHIRPAAYVLHRLNWTSTEYGRQRLSLRYLHRPFHLITREPSSPCCRRFVIRSLDSGKSH